MTPYNDEYATCVETYATLRVFTGDVSPDRFTEYIGVTPSKTQEFQIRPEGWKNLPGGWFLTSQSEIDSRDVRRHVDFVLDQIDANTDALGWIRKSGGMADVMCYWVSASGHGGPSLLPAQSSKLAALNLEIWFDVYFNAADDDDS